jgi:hypothetical protein
VEKGEENKTRRADKARIKGLRLKARKSGGVAKKENGTFQA